VPPTFLGLDPLPAKPRTSGLNHVLDAGLPLRDTAARVESHAEHIDIWKFGWGTSYVEPRLSDKCALLREHDILPCVGGTLLEVAWARGVVEEYFDWVQASGIGAVEVSRGSAPMSLPDKLDLVARAAERFVVIAETGFKSELRTLDAAEWFDEMSRDLRAGATYVVAEGRESGTVGIFDRDGEPVPEIVEASVSAAGLDRLIVEAPRKAQQAWFLNRFGAGVNLGNIAPADVVGVTTLRLGLRADTLALSIGQPSVSGR
jgi:phosphosulfolactate synthase